MELSKGDSMRNRMKELTAEEIKEQQAYVQEATKRDTVNKSAAARAAAPLWGAPAEAAPTCSGLTTTGSRSPSRANRPNDHGAPRCALIGDVATPTCRNRTA